LFSFIPQINAEPSTPPTKFIYANTLGTAGYTISESGCYVLVEDIDFAPTSTMANAITIDSNYVTLDFNTHSIAQTNATASVDGIEISADAHDVVVKNGTLHGFRGQTIQVNGGCFDLTFDSLNISGPGAACSGAMLFDGTGNPIHDVNIHNCNVTEIDPNLAVSGTNRAVCAFLYTHNLNIINSTFNNNRFTFTTSITNVFYITNSDKSRIINCHFDDNVRNEGEFEHRIIGGSSTEAAIIENCLFRRNSHDDSVGTLTIIDCNGHAMMVKGCNLLDNHGAAFQGMSIARNAVSIESCTIENCGATTAAGFGIYVYSTSDDVNSCYINDCHIIGGDYGAGVGIYLEAWNLADPAYLRDCRITNCSVQGVTGNGISLTETGSPAGISGCIVENCLTEGVSLDGFVITGTDNLIKDCHAVSNAGTGFNEQGDNVWLTNLASRNGTNYSVVPFGAIPHPFNKWGVDTGGAPYAVFENIDIP